MFVLKRLVSNYLESACVFVNLSMSSKSKVVFKDYPQHQLIMLPPSLEELIAPHHPVRVVNQVIEQVNLEPLLAKYKGGGTSSYHPRLLLKVIVYAYLTNIYSSRKIEEALQQNIHFMWLAANARPDHNTINRFRSYKLQEVLKDIFSQIVLLLSEQGLLSLKQVYLDGTKLESAANRYSFVWGKSIKASQERIHSQLNELWQYANQVAAQEMQDTAPLTFEQIEPEKVQQAIEQIDQALQQKKVDKKVKQKLSYARRHWPKKLQEYKGKQAILAGRNSYAKTDTDATFMRMKEDHMQNGQLKPGYNWQICTNNQFILHYTLHQTATDTTTLIPHLESLEQSLGTKPEEACADAGYGSEENYEWLEKSGIEAYVKYNYFHSEQRKKVMEDPFHRNNLYYNQQKDCYYCPMGQAMQKIAETVKKTTTGYEQHYSRYQAVNCAGCPLRGLCHKSKGNRILEVNHALERHKAKARERLLSEKGLEHRSKRPVEVEAVFGNIKSNHHFRRLLLRGLVKVEVETGLLALAHNLRKMASLTATKAKNLASTIVDAVFRPCCHPMRVC